MDKYVEYNLINNIPILYPTKNKIKYNFCPRYNIADSNKLLHCFTANKNNIILNKTSLSYIKIYENKSFKTLKNKVKTLYYYIILDSNIYSELDIHNHECILKWLKCNINNHYIIVTTPILEYKDIYYNIANDNNMSIIIHNKNELKDDELIIHRLINNNCFTICDNYNIIISLFQENIINRHLFIEYINILNDLKNFCYTSSLWIYYMHQHRILNACDFPMIFLMTKPYKLDIEIVNLFEWFTFDRDHNIYMQTYYKNEILFTTLLSCSYPNTNTQLIDLVLGNKSLCKLWINKENVSEKYNDLFDKNTAIFYNDYYGIFASFINVCNMWKLWCDKKYLLLYNLFVHNNDNNYILYVNIFCSLFRLYHHGYENIKIKRSRIVIIWNDIMNIIDNKNIIPHILEHFIILQKHINIPYKFLLDVHNKYNFIFKQKKCRIIYHENRFIYKNISLYDIYKINIPIFHNNIVKKKLIYILLCIYKKFDMFENNIYINEKYTKGLILLNHIRNNSNMWF